MNIIASLITVVAGALMMWFLIASLIEYRALVRLLNGLWFTEGASVQMLVEQGFARDMDDAQKTLEKLIDSDIVQVISGSQTPKIYGLMPTVKQMHDRTFELWVKR